MKAIGYNQPGPITAADALIEFEVKTQPLGSRDLLVEVRGISVNPVDVKVRAAFEAENGTEHSSITLGSKNLKQGLATAPWNWDDLITYPTLC